MQVALSARSIRKQFGTGDSIQHALRGVSLDVMAGEILMMRGPSGSGKTTMLSIMGGILTPTSGEVIVNGHSMAGLGQAGLAALRLQHLGFIFQEYNLFPTLNCTQNVMVTLDLKGIRGKEAQDRAEKILVAVGLESKLTAYPSKLSGGQKQRLAISRALVGGPAVILADEPTAALDSENGTIVTNLLRDLAKKYNRAVVIVTHDYRIKDVADRVVFIEDGLLVDGPH